MRDLNGVMFVFQLFHEVDVYRVMSMALWTFDNQLLLLDRLGKHASSLEIPLFHFPIWVQIRGLRPGYRSVKILTDIGNRLGSFLEVDPQNFDSSSWDSYMRICIQWDVRRPIKEELLLKFGKGVEFNVQFSYEHLPSLCLIYGFFSHTEKFYPKLLNYEPGKAIRKFSYDLRAPSR